jgi:Uma2 family endonuclease
VTILTTPQEIIYPDSDGEPMADNTKQADIMVFLKTNLDALFADDPDVFIAMDLLWYPVEGDNRTRLAPDVLVAFGRPKGYRGSYRQWEENGVAPQVVFEILSPGNRAGEMQRKLDFYEECGVEEYYIYNPQTFDFSGYRYNATQNRLRLIDPINDWTSPRLRVRFDAPGDRELAIYRPDGTPFRAPLEIRQELEDKRQELEQKQSENEKLAAKLRELGIDPNTL